MFAALLPMDYVSLGSFTKPMIAQDDLYKKKNIIDVVVDL